MKPRAACVAFLLIALAAGCGGGGHAEPISAEGAAQQLLLRRDVARYGPGTPARALMEWWRSAQFADVVGYRRLLSPPLRVKFDGQAQRIAAVTYLAGAIRDARPKIVDVVRRGRSTTVYTIIEYHQPVGSTRYITSSSPRAFTLTRVGGAWGVADDSFVQETLPASLRR